MADPDTPPPYDPKTGTPAYVAEEVEWIEGDHPTANPDGVTNSNVDYTPKTQEEKAALLNVEMVVPVDVAPDEPYPEDDPPDEGKRKATLRRVHAPMELVAAEDATAQQVANLAAGGSVEGAIPEKTVA